MKSVCLFLLCGCGLVLNAEENYREFQPKTTTRVRENTEWSQFSSYNTPDHKTPRLLIIGDSICNQYRAGVQRKLKGSANLSFWISSKCVTDPDYFKELDLILGSGTFTIISFNNGLHSLTTNRQEWENAYRSVVRFIRSRQPRAKLYLTNITPIANQRKEVVPELNQIIGSVAKAEQLPIIDFYSVIDPMDKSKWADGTHLQDKAVEKLSDCIAMTVKNDLSEMKKP